MVKCREIYHTWTVWAMLQSLLRVTLRWVWSNTRYKQVSWSMLEPGLRSGDSCHPKNSAARLFQPNNETNDLQFNHHIHGFSSNPPRNKKNTKGQPTPTFKGPSIYLFTRQNKIPNSPRPLDLKSSLTHRAVLVVEASQEALEERFRRPVFRWRGSGGSESTSGGVQGWDDNLVGGFLPNPIWKIWSSKWMISSQKSSEWKDKIFETTTWILLLDEIRLTSW